MFKRHMANKYKTDNQVLTDHYINSENVSPYTFRNKYVNRNYINFYYYFI